MSTNRIKLPPNILNRNRAEEILGEIAALKIQERDQKNCLDQAITTIKSQYGDTLVELGKAIEEKTALIERWAEQNPEEFPKNRKSIEMLHGIIGYRTGTPKLKTLRSCTWDTVLEVVKTYAPFKGFLRVKEEVNKEAILSGHSTGNLFEADLRTLGVKVVQDETFFVEPNLSEQEARETVKAA